MVNISFPGLGIEQFTVNKAAFELPFFGIQVRWYGILITIGIILAIFYCMWRAKQEKIILDDLMDMAIFTIIFAIVGARTFYVLMSLDEYDSFDEMIAIWNGGLAIYGAIIAGAVTILVVCKIKKINVMRAYDMVCPAVMIGQIIGRWGNFFNGEAHGSKVLESDLFYFIRMGLSYGNNKILNYYHPTFLYESVWNLVGFVIINLLYKKKKFDGQVFLMYITWYGFGRMLIEGLRTDSLYIGVFRVSQVIGFVCFVVGAICLVYRLVRCRREELTKLEYSPTYSRFSSVSTLTAQESDIEIKEDEDQKEEETDNSTEEKEYTGLSDKVKNLFDYKDEQ